MKSLNVCVLISLILFIYFLLPVSLASTAFTYQGRLLDNNVAADDMYDLQFKLYDDPNVMVAGQIGITVTQDNVDVVDGYFVAQLDFGSSVFDGTPLWLEVGVRPYESAEPNDFVPLSPLQPITQTPYAVYAASSGQAEITVPLELIGDIANPDAIITATNTSGRGINGVGEIAGVYGEHNSNGNYGFLGGNYHGVFGQTSLDGTSVAVFGKYYNGIGTDVYGMLGAKDFGVYGSHVASGNYGYVGHSSYAIYGNSTDDWAGYFVGKSYFDGDVGIGTQTPTQKLEVNGTVKATSFVGDGSGLTNLPSSNLWQQSGSGIYYNNGRVGIGTENPSNPLDIKTSSAGYISVERGSNQLGGALWKKTGASDTQWIFPFFRGWQSDNLIVREEVANLDVMTFQFGTGNVGIATSSPTEKLEVNGTVKATAFVGNGSGLTGINYSESDPKVGTLTTNYVPRWNGSILSDSAIADNGTTVGIGDSPFGNVKLRVKTVDDIGIYSTTTQTNYHRYAVLAKGEGDSTWSSYGVKGESTSATGTNYGVYGQADTSSTGNNYGVYGRAFNTGSGNAYAGYFNGNVYVTGEMSAQTVTDRTPYPKDLDTAYDAVMSMERLPDGLYDESSKENQLDHAKLNSFIQSSDGHRDLSATVSCLNEVVKDLVKKIDAQQQTIELQQKQIQQMTEMLQTNSLQNSLKTGALK